MLFDKHITLFQCIAFFSLTVIASGRLSPETAAKAREVNKQMSNQSNSKNVIKTLTEFRAVSQHIEPWCLWGHHEFTYASSVFSTLLFLILIPKLIQLIQLDYIITNVKLNKNNTNNETINTIIINTPA